MLKLNELVKTPKSSMVESYYILLEPEDFACYVTYNSQGNPTYRYNSLDFSAWYAAYEQYKSIGKAFWASLPKGEGVRI